MLSVAFLGKKCESYSIGFKSHQLKCGMKRCSFFLGKHPMGQVLSTITLRPSGQDTAKMNEEFCFA